MAVDFNHAVDLANRIRKGENDALRRQLIDMCIPYFLGVRSRFGFYRLSRQDIVEELAADAVTDTIVAWDGREDTFLLHLQNAFRKHCRQCYRYMRRPAMGELIEHCDPSYLPGITGSRCHGNIGAEHNECLALIGRELQDHEKTSKTAIYERMRGSSYQEITFIIGGKDAHKSRALFWDNIKRIRKNLRSHNTRDQGEL